MSSGDGQSAVADKITGVANDLCAVSWEVWNAAVILLVASVTVGNSAKDAGLDSSRAILNGAVDKSGSLRVTTDQEDGGWTAAGGVVEKILHLADSGEIGSTWKEVGGEASCVVDTLNGDVGGTKCALETLTGWWTDGGTLVAC